MRDAAAGGSGGRWEFQHHAVDSTLEVPVEAREGR